MEVPLEGDVQGSTGEGSSPEEDSRHGHVGVHPDSFSMEMQQIHKSHMLKRFQCLMEGHPHQGSSTLLRKIYTDLYITEGGRGDVNEEHEVRQIERISWREAAQGKPIKCSDIFERLTKQGKASSQQVKASAKEGQQSSEQVKPIGIVLTMGVAGIGKTISVQKLILDWAEGTSNQDLDFIFPIPFRELNLMKEKDISLVDLIKHFFSDVEDPSVFIEKRVMFIFDGLDECRLSLDFHHDKKHSDVTKSVPVDVLLTNLIQGNLLPSALLWITTRPAAANQIPQKCVKQVTEIQGFNNQQKEEYFRKKISNESLASRTIAHLKSSRILFIMCHIPVFSWILATVVETTSDGSGSAEMPRTLTQMYTHFLIIQVRIKHTKYAESDQRDEEMIYKLGKLAFQQLEKGNLIFYEKDLIECGIDVTEASVYSGVCTQIFREEAGLYQGKVFSFIHLSIQEFLAALYVFLCFINRERNMPDQHHTSQLSVLFRAATLHDLHKTAVDLALLSKNGHLDLFLRFLLGLSLESNQSLLRHLLPQTSSQSQSSEQTVQLVKQKIRQQKESNRRINLFYCLNELNQHAVVEHIDRRGTLTIDMLLPGQWNTEEFKFKTSEEYLDGFDLQKYIKTPELDQTDLLSPDDVLQKLTDVFTSSTSAELEYCPLSTKSFSHMVSALTSHTSRLRQLKLKDPDRSSYPSLSVSSSAGCHPDCKPWELSLQGYHDLTEICNLVSALTSHTSTLSGKRLKEEEEVERLCSTLSHQDCRLEELELKECPLSEKSVSYVTSYSSCLTQLKLVNSNNDDLQDSAVELLCSALCRPNCKLETLWLEMCPLSVKSVSHLVSALTSDSSRLTQLQLENNDNDMQDSAVELLCSVLCHLNCKLQTLKLKWCPLSEKSASHLVCALTSHSSHLTQLELEGVIILDESMVKKLTALQNDPHYQMKISWLSYPYGPSKQLLHLSCRVLEDSEVTSAHHQQQSQEDDDHSGDTQRGCKYCAEVPDTSHWVLVEPEVSTEKSISTYSLSSAAGSYECSLSGLRWLCPGPINFQYHFKDWHVFAKELTNMQCSPAGPLMDIKLTSGELEEIHLPHFLCLGCVEASVCDAVRVLHGHDSGVCMEVRELTRHHARLLQPSLSPLVVVWNTVKEYLFSPNVPNVPTVPNVSNDPTVPNVSNVPNIHCELLLFCISASPSLKLHVYLVPDDKGHIKAIHQKEKAQGVWIDKPGTVTSLRLDASVRVKTLCQSEINPENLVPLPLSTSNYSEVYIKDPVASLDDGFKMELISPPENGKTIWTATIRRDDCKECPPQQPRRTLVDPLLAAVSLEEKRAELIQRVTEVMPIADQLFDQGFIGQETYSNIHAATCQEKMRLLFEGLRSAGAQGKLAFYTILQTKHPHLVEELWTAR